MARDNRDFSARGRFAPWLLVAALVPLLANPQPAVCAERAVSFERIKLGLAHVGLASRRGDQVAVRWLGSGFIVGNDCMVVTAKHILDTVGTDDLIVRFLHPDAADAVRTFPVREVHRAPDKDVAFLRFADDRFARRFCKSELRPLTLPDTFDREALTGRSVLVAGFPALEGEQPRDPPIVRHGIVASAELEWLGSPMLLLDLTGVPGFSGAPVILEDSGAVIGVVFGPGRTERKYDLEWATPVVARDYESLGRSGAGR